MSARAAHMCSILRICLHITPRNQLSERPMHIFSQQSTVWRDDTARAGTPGIACERWWTSRVRVVSAGYAISRAYLETLADLPWSRFAARPPQRAPPEAAAGKAASAADEDLRPGSDSSGQEGSAAGDAREGDEGAAPDPAGSAARPVDEAGSPAESSPPPDAEHRGESHAGTRGATFRHRPASAAPPVHEAAAGSRGACPTSQLR